MSAVGVAAVMTVFNRRELTLACLQSLQDQRDHGSRIAVYVCDDASTDGTPEAIAAEFPDVHLVKGDGNLYWNGGMRRAFAAAMADDHDFYWWLNDDTHLDADALARLLSAYREVGEGQAIVVGSTRDPHDGQLTYGGVARASRWRPLHFERLEPLDTPRRAETMNGNCVLLPRAVVQRVGNIDPAYRQKMGDFDYGMRARAAGCDIWVAPGTFGSCATHPPRRTDQQPLLAELRRLASVKELPPRPWRTFTRRYGGALWPLYFVSPYVQRGARLVTERLRKVAFGGTSGQA